MAKNKKKVNKNIQKRQQQKKKKRELNLKKKGSNTSSSKVSYSKAKNYIVHMPYLVFEPEIDEVRFPREKLEAFKDGTNLREELAEMDVDALLDDLKLPLVELQMRVHEKADPRVNFCAKVLEKMIETKQEMSMIFPFVMAKYIKDKRDALEPDNPLTPENLLEILETEMAEAEMFEEHVDAEDETEDDTYIFDDGFNKSELGSVLSDFENFLIDEKHLTDDALDSPFAEIDLFLQEYLYEHKEISTLEGIQANTIPRYLTGWYTRQANPSKEEMGEILDYFGWFFEFLEKKELIPAESLTEMTSKLADREYFLDMAE